MYSFNKHFCIVQLCHHPMVDYIEEDQEITVASQWHLDRIDQKTLPLNHQYSAPNNGSNVDIYIFDTGMLSLCS